VTFYPLPGLPVKGMQTVTTTFYPPVQEFCWRVYVNNHTGIP